MTQPTPIVRPHRAISVAALAVLLAANLGHSEERPNPAALHALATEALGAEKFATAVRLYEQAYAVDGEPNTLFGIARAAYLQFQRTGNVDFACKACQSFQQYLDRKQGARAEEDREYVARARGFVKDLAPFTTPTAVHPPPGTPEDPTPAASEADGADPAEIRDPCAARVTPPPPTQLMVSSDTPGARISIGDFPPTESPAVAEVLEGDVLVRVAASGFATVESRVRVPKGHLVTRQVELSPLPGSIQVTASELGAEVFVDGIKVGTTPYEGGGYASGTHSVAVRQSGRRLWGTSLEVTAEETSTATALLQPSSQRTAANYVLAGAGAAFVAGTVTGLVALKLDSSLDDMPKETNQERAAWDDRLGQRDALATSSTVLFAVAGAALVVAGGLYWLDTPPTPSAGKSARAVSGLRERGGLRF